MKFRRLRTKMFRYAIITLTMVIFSRAKSLETITNATTTKSQLTMVQQTKSVSGEKIIFPDTFDKDKANIRPRSNMDDCPFNFCETVDDYPEDYINGIIQNTPWLEGAFDDPITITNRINDDVDDSGLCEKVVKTVYPKKALNVDNEERFIFNSETSKQGIVVEICKNTENQCKLATLFKNMGYKAVCIQKFAETRLISLRDSIPDVDRFKMPSCCMCSVKSVTAP